MRTKNKFLEIFAQSIPILVMIFFIPFIKNDYLLSAVYIVIISISLLIKYEKRDLVFLIFGLIVMIIFEYIFIMTGVEIFKRTTLFGVMPLWLPILWAYAFVAIRRGIKILEEKARR